MKRIIPIAILLVLTSFYVFPFCFRFLPEVNTKMAMAGMGLVIFFLKMGTGSIRIDRNIVTISLLAALVSLISFAAMVINNTTDTTYVTYIVSMWVWLGGAYFLLECMRKVHGHISVELVCYYIIAVGALQCLTAIAIDSTPWIKHLVDSNIVGERFMGAGLRNRLYGIGCALDVAGSRFAVMLVMIAFLMPRVLTRRDSTIYFVGLTAAFCIIAIIGNIIGRTTTVGIALAVIYWIWYFQSHLRSRFSARFLIVLGIFGALLYYLYNYNEKWNEQVRFGFEGFVSLAEKGEWDVKSNDMLVEGFVFPDNLKTWIIGDGYIDSAMNDPYYTGEEDYGFYKNTDAGYCRFIFYFGLIGLAAFAAFFVTLALACMRRLPQFKPLFLAILIVNFAVWFKTTTDMFLLFAPFLLISQKQEEEYEKIQLPRR